MNYEEFLKKDESADESAVESEPVSAVAEEEVSFEAGEQLDVQKAVVESLAADKAMQDETIGKLQLENTRLQLENARLKAELAEKGVEIERLHAELEQMGDKMLANVECPENTAVTLLERNLELNDRFVGETHDHVLEALSEARARAEAEGRVRCAQVLEGVLLTNTPCGTLKERRAALEKLFADNLGVVNGQVINALDKLDISYKNGENYLLPKEIVLRTY